MVLSFKSGFSDKTSRSSTYTKNIFVVFCPMGFSRMVCQTSGSTSEDQNPTSESAPAKRFLHAAPLDFSPYKARVITATLPINVGPN